LKRYVRAYKTFFKRDESRSENGVKSGSDADRYGYQGEYAECDPETATTSGSESIGGWNSFDLRMYDANVGRFLSTDPMGQFHSPYIGMGNNPISGIDPTGGLVDPPSKFGASDVLEGSYHQGTDNEIYQSVNGSWKLQGHGTINSPYGSTTLPDDFTSATQQSSPSILTQIAQFGHAVDNALEGNEDGPLTGGDMGGQYGWEHKGGREFALGTATVLTGGAGMAIGGTVTVVGVVSVASGVNSMANTDGVSFAQTLAPNETSKAIISAIETGASVYTGFKGGASLFQSSISPAERFVNASGTAIDVYSIISYTRSQLTTQQK